MGIPWGSIRISDVFSTEFLTSLLTFPRNMLIAALSRLGLIMPQEEEFPDDNPGYVIVMDRRCPIPVPIEVDVLTVMIKRRLPVIDYGTFLERSRGHSEEHHEGSKCSVCLDWMKKRDEIRILCNCSHVFHRQCLDNWVDSGQITCPVCRSSLFPETLGALRSSGDDLWLTERNTFVLCGSNDAASASNGPTLR